MDLEQFAERRRKHRIYHDAIDFALPTADVNIDFQDHTTSAGVNKPRAVISISIKPPKAYNSRGILEECMFAAGIFSLALYSRSIQARRARVMEIDGMSP